MELVEYSSKSTSSDSTNPSWQDMFRSSSRRKPTSPVPVPSPIDYSPARLPLYIAMSHAGLLLSLFAFYGVFRLLEGYFRPLQWAIICSIPLRGVQKTLVLFWSEPLKLGFTETLLAVPVAVFRVFIGTIVDFKDFIFQRKKIRKVRSGFSKLLRWLVCFGVLGFVYENVGVIGVSGVLGFGFLFSDSSVDSTMENVSNFRSHSLKRSKLSGFLTRGILKRLETVVAIGLIVVMIFGFVFCAVFFSYKIGVESKDAIFAVKTRVENSNYAEKVGVKKWMDDNDVDNYTTMFYDTISQQIDGLAMQYNMTEFVIAVRHFVMTKPANSSDSSIGLISPWHSKLIDLKVKFKDRALSEVYNDVDYIIRELVENRIDLLTNAKSFAIQGLDIGANLILAVFGSIFYGAANFINFIFHSMVFFWVLYYLIASNSGGVTQKVLHLLPLPNAIRTRCVEVLDKEISGVMLGTAKISLVQGCSTWLLFRLFSIHFLYMSTLLAFIGPLFPLFPPCLATVPAAVQLILEGKYILAVCLCVIHIGILQYEAYKIQDEVPGYNTYLMGLSIIGGMTLFPSALEGAILGPVITTVVIALKDLYTEFVLNEPKQKRK